MFVNRLVVSHANAVDFDAQNSITELTARTCLALQMLGVDPFELFAMKMMACTRITAAQPLCHFSAILFDLVVVMIVNLAVMRVLITVLNGFLIRYVVGELNQSIMRSTADIARQELGKSKKN